MTHESVITHEVFGKLYVTRNTRAKRFLFRPAVDGLKVTMPYLATMSDLTHCIDEMTPRLTQMVQKSQEKVQHQLISNGTTFVSDVFSLNVAEGQVRRPAASLRNGHLVITCPPETDYNASNLQSWFVKVIEESLRHVAKLVLTKRMQELAQGFGFHFNAVSIHKTHGRWGSCSSKKNINLSLYLLMLPQHLRDYVMLHELCHTKEMNHGPRFWKLMDDVTDGKSGRFRQEMKQYDTNVTSILFLKKPEGN